MARIFDSALLRSASLLFAPSAAKVLWEQQDPYIQQLARKYQSTHRMNIPQESHVSPSPSHAKLPVHLEPRTSSYAVESEKKMKAPPLPY